MPTTAPRCLLVAQTFPPLIGGSAEVYAAIARHAGGRLAVLAARRDHATGREFVDASAHDAACGYRVRRVALIRPPRPAAAPTGGLRRRFEEVWRTGLLAAAVALEARRFGADAICVCDDDVVGWLVPFARHVLRRRALIYCHGDDLVCEAPAFIRARARWFGHAHAVIAAGAYAAQRLREPFGVPPARIVTIANGVELARFQPMPADPALRARLGLVGRRVIIAPSRLVPRKGIDRLIEAMPAILAQQPQAALLVVGDGEQRAALEAMATGLPVRFAGAVAVADMAAHYALAELMALPNRAEAGEVDGLPLVFLEAQACGLPVIGGQAGGTAEAVRDGQTGLLVSGEEPDAIAAAVLRLLGDAELATRLAAAGRQSALRQGWESRAVRFLEACRPDQAAMIRPAG